MNSLLAQARVHFIGIGGIGMCGLAELLHNMGAKVSGSDLHENAQLAHLRDLGVEVHVGHRADLVGDVDVVVYSSAVRPENVEFAEAKRKEIPRIPRAEVLAEIMRLKRGVAVAGTHGKTTTTSLIAAIFLAAENNPTIVIGGRLDLIKSTALLGKGDWLIAEADESDGSFLALSPEIAVITNIDNDHMDYFGSLANLQKGFLDFASRIPFYGLLVACGDDQRTRECLANFGKRVLFYGASPENDFYLSKVELNPSTYEVFRGGELLGRFSLTVPGFHNALNALAAIVVGLQAGIPFALCAQGLARFNGVDRRFQLLGSEQGILVYDDYGHHPTEIRAVVQAFSERHPNQRLFIAFQPHRYSRTQLCFAEFADSFAGADQVFIYDIYAAGENPIAEINSQNLVKSIHHPRVSYLPSSTPELKAQGLNRILGELRAGDIFLTLGAGDISKEGPKILAQLRQG